MARPTFAAIALVLSLLAGAAADTTYYFDHLHTAGSPAGTAANPWTSWGATQNSAVSSALASGNVTVYFTALKADGVTQESYTNSIALERSDTGANRLTLDGASFYNTSKSSPSWSANPTDISLAHTNSKVFRVYNGASNLGIGHDVPTATNRKQDNITVRGFELTGTGPRLKFHGDNVIVEYIYYHDVTAIDPSIFPAQYTYHLNFTNAADTYCAGVTNVKVRYARFVRQHGEAIYVGAVPDTGVDAAEDAAGQQHQYFEFHNIYFEDIGLHGGQGDCFDLKRGIGKVWIHDCYATNWLGIGMVVSAGNYGTSRSDVLVERIMGVKSPASASEGWLITAAMATPPSTRSLIGFTNRNCIAIETRRGIGPRLSSGTPVLNDVVIRNNTVYHVNVPFQTSGATNLWVQNNLFVGTTNISVSVATGGTATMDYNDYWGTWSSGLHGGNDYSLADENLFVSPPLDLTLQSGVHPHNSGTSLSSTFTDDYLGISRPQGAAWDRGALELYEGAGQSYLASPGGLRFGRAR